MKLSKLEHIRYLPKRISVNGMDCSISMWVTAWGKLAIGYREMCSHRHPISFIIGDNPSIDYSPEKDEKSTFYSYIEETKSIPEAFTKLENLVFGTYAEEYKMKIKIIDL